MSKIRGTDSVPAGWLAGLLSSLVLLRCVVADTEIGKLRCERDGEMCVCEMCVFGSGLSISRSYKPIIVVAASTAHSLIASLSLSRALANRAMIDYFI